MKWEEKEEQRCGLDDSGDIWIERVVGIENECEKEEKKKDVHSSIKNEAIL